MVEHLIASDDRKTVREAAQDLAPVLATRAAEGEALRTMPGDLVAWCAGDAPDLGQRARMLLAANHAMHAGVEAVDAVFRLAGASAVFSDQPLARCFRDIHTANQHIIFSGNRDKAFAKVQFGIDQLTFSI